MTTPEEPPCPEVADALLDEAAGEITAADSARLSAHVATCPRCREARARLRRSLLQTRSLLVPEPSEEYWESFVPRLHERIRTSQRGIPLADIRRKLDTVTSAGPAAAAPDAAAEPPSPRLAPAPAPPPAQAPRREASRWLVALAAAASVALVVAAPLLLGRARPEPMPVVRETAAPVTSPDDEPSLGTDDPLALVAAPLDSSLELDHFVDELSNEDADLLDAWLGRELAS